MKRGFLQFWLALAVALLASCTCKPGANGDGYCGAAFKAQDPDDGSGTAGGGNSQTLDKIFYRLDDTYTCFDSETGTTIPSYRSAIVYSKNRYTWRGDLCHPSEMSLFISDLEFSRKGDYIGYGNGIYEYRATTPTYGPGTKTTETWCSAITTGTGSATVDTFIRRENGTYSAETRFEQVSTVEELTYSITKGTDGSGNTLYQGMGFDLVVQALADLTFPDKHPGTLTTSLSTNEPLRCRVLP